MKPARSRKGFDFMPSVFEYPASLVGAIKDATGTDVRLPSEGTLRELLDVAFFAGLETDEGRNVAFTLAFIDPAEIDRVDSSIFCAMPFADPIALAVREVVKLAPAVDYKVAAIGVRESQANSGLEIWGLYRHGSSEYDRLEGRRFQSFEIGFPFIKVTCLGPGRLDVDFGDARVASLVGGQVRRQRVGIFSAAGPVCDTLRTNAKNHGDNSYVVDVQKVVWEIRASDHGGTLIILPDNSMEGFRPSRYAAVFDSQGTGNLRECTKEVLQLAQKHSDWIQKASDAEKDRVRSDAGMMARSALNSLRWAERNHMDAVRFFSALAGVDGALVLGPDLRVVSFGTMIEWTKGDEFDIHLAADAGGRVEKTTKVADLGGGARHQSAAHFCHRRHGAIAFVVSQDGQVSCFLNDGNFLRLWRDVSLDFRDTPVRH